MPGAVRPVVESASAPAPQVTFTTELDGLGSQISCLRLAITELEGVVCQLVNWSADPEAPAEGPPSSSTLGLFSDLRENLGVQVARLDTVVAVLQRKL